MTPSSKPQKRAAAKKATATKTTRTPAPAKATATRANPPAKAERVSKASGGKGNGAAAKTAANPTPASTDKNQNGSDRLKPGGLEGLVRDYLAANRDKPVTPGEIARALGGRSAGAILNNLEKWASSGELLTSTQGEEIGFVIQTSTERPRAWMCRDRSLKKTSAASRSRSGTINSRMKRR